MCFCLFLSSWGCVWLSSSGWPPASCVANVGLVFHCLNPLNPALEFHHTTSSSPFTSQVFFFFPTESVLLFPVFFFKSFFDKVIQRIVVSFTTSLNSSLIHPPSLLTHTHLSNSFLFLVHLFCFVLPMYSWTYGFPWEHGQLTRNHTGTIF